MTGDILQLLRSAANALLAQGALHGELFCLELAEAKLRLWRMVVALLTCAIFLLCSLLSLAALVVILSWGTPYQNLALFGVPAFFVIGAAIAWLRFRTFAQNGQQPFSGTLAEIGADLTLIREKLGD
jgi:uncharacterized membrane protein YqjE